jgi:hypothetical protein
MPGSAENAENRRCHDGIGWSASRPIPQFKGLDIQMYPEFPTLLLPCLDLAGTAVFATSGALAAARAGQTPLTGYGAPMPAVVLCPVLSEVADIIEQIFHIACTANLGDITLEDYDAAACDHQAAHWALG